RRCTRLLPVFAVERRNCGRFRLALIVLGMQRGIVLRRFNAGTLLGGWLDVLCLRRGFLLYRGLGLRAARAVKAGPAARILIHDLFVDVGIVNHRGVHPAHGCVIAERIAHPFAAIVAIPPVAVAVIDPTVEPDRRSPVALVKNVAAATVAPIARSPEQSDARRSDPDAGDPVVTEISPGPVARNPNIARGRTERLLV